MALSDIDGDGAELADVLDELRTLPFLGDRRAVVLRRADSFITKNREALEKYAANPCPTGTLILVCKSLPANTRLHKLIRSVGTVIKCEAPKGRAVTQWLVQRCREEYGCGLDTRAAARLRELAGDDLGVLDSELAKLRIYAGRGARITSAHVNELVGAYREENVFAIVEAMLTGDAARGIRLWNQVWATNRAAPFMAVGGLAWALRRIINAKASLDAGAPLDQVADQMRIDQQRVSAQTTPFTLGQLENLLCGLRDTDAAAKTGPSSVRDAVERFIIQTACRTRGGARAISA
jgi:DNA polymerase-3 subunit delta